MRVTSGRVGPSRMKSGSGGQLGCAQARVRSKGWNSKAYLRVNQNSVRVDVQMHQLGLIMQER
jgi:hypothetical protein